VKVSRSRLISNSIFSIITSFISQIIAFIVIPLFIARLGEDLYGIWVLSNLILGYMGIFDFGFTQGILRFIVEAREEKDHEKLKMVISSGIMILFLIGLVLGGLVILFRDGIIGFFNIETEFYRDATFLLIISGAFCIIQWPLKILDCYLNAYLKIKELSILQGIGTALASLTLLVSVWLSFDIRTIKIIHSITLFLTAFASYGLILWLKLPFPFSLSRFSFGKIRQMSKFSLGMFYNKILNLISIQIDPFVIGRMMDMTSVTHYSISSKIYNIILSYIRKIMSSLLPAVYNLNSLGDHKRIQRLYHQGIRYRIIFSSFMAYPAIVFASPFIQLWVGEEYVWLAKWSALYCAVPLLIPFGVATNMARGMGHLKKINLIFTLKALLNISLSILLVPHIGVGGPLVGTLVATTLLGDFLFFPYFSKLIDCEWKPVIKDYFYMNSIYICISVISFGIMYFLPGAKGLILSIAFIVPAAMLSTWFLILKSEEKQDIIQILKKVKVIKS